MKWIKGHLLVNIILALASVTATLIIMEFASRLTSYRILISHADIPRYYYRTDQENGYDIAPNFTKSKHIFSDLSYSVWSNELGCFDNPYGGENPYVYLAGDSFTWGFAPFKEKWGTKLENFLEARVLKCGVAGYGTKQELIKAKRTLTALPAPKLIILGYFLENDLEDDASFPNRFVYDGYLIKKLEDRMLSFEEAQKRLPEMYEWRRKYCMGNRPAHPAFQRVKCFLTRNSIAYHLAKNAIKRVVPESTLRDAGVVNESAPQGLPITEEDRRRHLNHIIEFRDFASELGSEFLVMLAPSSGDVRGDNDSANAYELFKTFLERERIAYLDLRDDFRCVDETGKTLYWESDPHWNVRGNRLAGLLATRQVLENSQWVANHEEKLATVKKELLDEFSIK